MLYFYLTAAFIFGTIIGSFLNVVIYRLPQGLRLTGRSFCPHCHRILSSFELVPLFSFLLLGRKCKECRAAISWRYFIIELATGLLFALAWLYFPASGFLGGLKFIRLLFILAVLLVIFVIDLEYYLILDKLLLFSSAILLIFNFLLNYYTHQAFISWSSWGVGGILAGVLGALPFFAIWFFSHGKWMGFGDVKLMLFLGLVMGWPDIWLADFLAILLGGAVSVGLLAFSSKTLKSKIPFGTFLSLGAAVGLFFGHAILAWYLGLLGL